MNLRPHFALASAVFLSLGVCATAQEWTRFRGPRTGSSKLATVRRLMPKTEKKASQKDLASASSRSTPSQSREKAMAL